MQTPMDHPPPILVGGLPPGMVVAATRFPCLGLSPACTESASDKQHKKAATGKLELLPDTSPAPAAGIWHSHLQWAQLQGLPAAEDGSVCGAGGPPPVSVACSGRLHTAAGLLVQHSAAGGLWCMAWTQWDSATGMLPDSAWLPCSGLPVHDLQAVECSSGHAVRSYSWVHACAACSTALSCAKPA